MDRNREELPDNVILRLLQDARGARPWASLDETRQCVLCEQNFSGRQLRIEWDRSGAPHPCCPTPGCPATPAQWIHPGNPLVSEDAWHDWVRLLDTLCDEPVKKRLQPCTKFNPSKRRPRSSKKARHAFGQQASPFLPELIAAEG